MTGYDLLGYGIFGLAGLLFGGLLAILIHRYPLDLPLFAPLRCIVANEPITLRDWLPLFGYVAQRGRCRHCHKPLPLRYTVIEIITALCFGLTFNTYGWNVRSAVFCIFEALLIVIGAIDFRHRTIFPIMIYAGVAAAFLWSIFDDNPANALVPGDNAPATLAGAAIGGAMFLLIYGVGLALFRVRALGFGDVYLAVLIGALTGFRLALPTLFLGSLLGSLFAIAILLRRKRGMRDFVPFGTWMAAAAILGFIFGPSLWRDGPLAILGGLVDLIFMIILQSISLWLGGH